MSRSIFRFLSTNYKYNNLSGIIKYRDYASISNSSIKTACYEKNFEFKIKEKNLAKLKKNEVFYFVINIYLRYN